MIGAITQSAYGMQVSALQMTQAAVDITVSSTQPAPTETGEAMTDGMTVQSNHSVVFSNDLMSAVVAFKLGQFGYQANAKALAAADAGWHSLLQAMDTVA